MGAPQSPIDAARLRQWGEECTARALLRVAASNPADPRTGRRAAVTAAPTAPAQQGAVVTYRINPQGGPNIVTRTTKTARTARASADAQRRRQFATALERLDHSVKEWQRARDHAEGLRLALTLGYFR